MKRTVKVPIWASITFPLVMGFFFNFIGVLLAGPILAVVYAYKRHNEQTRTTPEVMSFSDGKGRQNRIPD